MTLELQPDFAAWIQKESTRLPELVTDLTEVAKASSSSDDPGERPVVNVREEDVIGEIVVSQTDLYGRLVTRFFPLGQKTLGLTGDNLVEVLKFAERISSRKELRDIISADTIREIVLEWIGAVVRDRPAEPIVTTIIKTTQTKVRQLEIWIPIEETQVAGELVFADATLKMVSLKEVDALMETRLRTAPAESARIFKDRLRRQWGGKAAMCFAFEAEPRRAQELAFERAENYMALLQFFGAAPLLLDLTSYSAPSGARPREAHRSISFSRGSFVNTFAAVLGPTVSLEFTPALADDVGFQILSSLGSGPACNYEDALAKSLLVYGRACYQVDPIDKLLQIITAVEMFTLKDDNEPISTSVADRVAFLIGNKPDERQSIVKNFKDVYGMRSKKTHHGHSISDTKEIETFLENIWKFFYTAIRRVGTYRTRMDFLAALDHVKYK